MKVLITGGKAKSRNGLFHPSEYWDESRWDEGRLNQKMFKVWRPDYPVGGNWHQRHHVVYWLHTGIVPDWNNQREMIHHKNHDHSDDRFENLQFMTVAEHSTHHNTKKLVWFVCVNCGISFPKVNGKIRKFCSLACYQVYPVSEETREKMSISKTGRESAMKGRTHSLETRMLISVGNKGKGRYNRIGNEVNK